MKKLTLITAIALALTSHSPASASSEEQALAEEPANISSLMGSMIKEKWVQTLLEKQYAEFEAATKRADAVSEQITKLQKHVDKTWYVFAGSTPEGWDCSGLVLWFYKGLGTELEHSATKQMRSGEIVEEPMPGDIVSFSHNGYDSSYHNGIYIGNGMMIDSPQKGNKTRVKSVLEFAGSTEITYTRITVDVVD